MDYLIEIKNKYPKIVKYEEDDFEWYNIGLDYLEVKEYQKALPFLRNYVCHNHNHLMVITE
jgi:hypothetical protein